MRRGVGWVNTDEGRWQTQRRQKARPVLGRRSARPNYLFAYCLLPTAYCLLPIADCLLPIAHRLDLLESGPRLLEFGGEQPHRVEDFAKGRRGSCPVRLAEGEDGI